MRPGKLITGEKFTTIQELKQVLVTSVSAISIVV